MTRRLLVSYLGLTLLILAVLEIPLALQYSERLRSDLTSDLVRDGFAIAGFAEETVEGTGSMDLTAIVNRYEERTGARVIIVDQSGKVLADSAPDIGSSDFSSRPEVATALNGEVATGTRHSDTLNTELLYVAVPIASAGQVHGAVRITYSVDQLNERWRRYLLTLLGIAAVSMTAAALLGVLFARWVNRPIDRLEASAVALGSGDLSTRAEVDRGPPEVRQLAATFNAMATQLDELVQAQQAFVADASHQLRTPLAALRLRLEILQQDVDALDGAGVTVAEDLDAALDETARLSRIVDGLLALARADRAAGADIRRLEVQALFDDRLAAWQPFAAEHGVELRAEDSDLAVLASNDRVTQVLDNLIANAIDAVPRGGHIKMRAHPTEFLDEPDRSANGYVTIHVADDGPGMTAEQRTRAFDRFWRGSTATDTGTVDPGSAASPAVPAGSGGSGIGLAIAQKLVRADHGEIALRASDGGGLDAVIHLPAP